ncbi:hypothetical protein [Thiohalophilus thiocyanatoxydans]
MKSYTCTTCVITRILRRSSTIWKCSTYEAPADEPQWPMPTLLTTLCI